MAEKNNTHSKTAGDITNEFYRTIMEQARDIILVVAPDGKIIDANQSASTAYGYSLDELRSICVYDLRSPETRIAVDAQIKKAQQEGILFRTIHMRRNGDHFPVEVSSRRIQLLTGEAVVSIVRDITEAVASETESLQRNMVLTALHETAMGLMQSLDMNDVLTAIVSRAANLVGTSHGFISILDEEQGVFERKIGLGHYVQDVGRKIRLTEGFSGQVYKTGEIIVVDDYSTSRHRLNGPFFDRIYQVAWVPLKKESKVIGVFGLSFLEPTRRFSDQEISLLVQFAEIASIALVNARLHNSLIESEKKLKKNNEDITALYEELLASDEELKQQFDELLIKEEAIRRQTVILKSLHDTALGLMHRRDSEDLLKQIVVGATELVGTPHGFIYRLDKEKGVFYQSHGLGTFKGNVRRDMPIDQGIAGTVYRTGKPMIANDFSEWRNRYSVSAQFEELCSVLQIPLKSEGEVVGIIGLAYCEEQKAFGSNELEILSRLAELASIALDNAIIVKTMWRMAYYDSLTGLPNRAYLQERLARELEKASRGEATGTVLFIDLDDLKMINDTLGHSCGDSVIVKAGACILAAAGEHSVVARIGGDEFIVLLPNESDQTKAGCLADNMVKLLSRDYEIGDSRIHMSASIGIALYPSDGGTVEDIFKNADLAMYAAKGSGKNTWRFHEASLQVTAYENMMLKRDLREAIERGELSLQYQPLVDAQSGCVVSFEALLRWTSSEHGSVPPSRFIPLAEESDTIRKIGKWVIEEACRFARKLSAMGKGEIRVSVNVSPRQLVAGDFVAIVCKAIDRAGIKPNQLEIEITENALIDSLEDSNDKFRELRAIGVGLSLDDFGTGYSSLTYLRSLPVETLKIDKSFIDLIVSDEAQLQFISSIVDMAHVLRLAVVAEGVETKEQLEKLVKCQCDFIQGYLFSHPLPEKEAILYLDRLIAEGTRGGANWPRS
ncbi:hypothetical protein AXX12_00275 [Anaerosporomusa subterranea]|uniref:Diguanylate cyclase n=1 Tax=Anaerosporomusa subterranea TaxID=1794912 RepID=A0A154BVK4_ANASB|nr:EAL domain-containing protein [Anaerosporomusa subterranea]KYZ78016.1 hypothetical protein AXX12_00275 [Anaerosporomusa subterranea]